MSYEPRLSDKVLSKLDRFPTEALSELARTVGRVCEDPYDAMVSLPVRHDPHHRWAEFGGADFVELTVDDAETTVTVEDLAWVG